MLNGVPEFNRTLTIPFWFRAIPVWSFAFRDDPERPVNWQECIKAASVSEVLRVVCDPSANLCPLPDAGLPEGANGSVEWTAGSVRWSRRRDA